MTLEGVCSLLARFPLKFQPGTRWNYGLSTDVCARLVEILSGRPFDEYLRTEVFEPLGMVDTGFAVPDDSPVPLRRLLHLPPRWAAQAQRRPRDQPLPAPPLLPVGCGRPGGHHR